MRQEQLTIEILPGEGSVTVRLVGEIDMDTAPKARDAALCAMRQHASTIHIDLSGGTFMDSTGLEVLLATRRHAELEGGCFSWWTQLTAFFGCSRSQASTDSSTSPKPSRRPSVANL